jgi:CRISPR-associated protein Cas6
MNVVHPDDRPRRAPSVAAAARGYTSVIDVVFELAGSTLPADHAQSLLEAIRRRLPWLAPDGGFGIHPLRANSTDYGVVLLAHRAKLVLRVPENELGRALALQGQTLDVVGSRLDVGEGRSRPLRSSATLHAVAVTFGDTDDAGFERDVAAALAALAVECDFISGRRRTARAGRRAIAGYSLALHGLRPEDSLTVQALGLGSDRALGWGLFVPAKAIS